MLITENQHNSNWREAMISVAYEWLDAYGSDYDRYHAVRPEVAAYLGTAPACVKCGAVAALTHDEGGCSHD